MSKHILINNCKECPFYNYDHHDLYITCQNPNNKVDEWDGMPNSTEKMTKKQYEEFKKRERHNKEAYKIPSIGVNSLCPLPDYKE